MHGGREARDQGQGIHLDADGTVAERFLELDGDQTVSSQGDVLLRDGGPQHVVEQVGPADIVLGPSTGSSVERESSILDAQRAHDLGAGCGGQDDGERFATQFGTSKRQPRDGGGRELGERRLSLGEVVGEKSGLALGLGVDGNPGRVPIPSRDATLPAKPAGSARNFDHVAANQVSQQPGADDREQIRDATRWRSRQSWQATTAKPRCKSPQWR